LPELPFNNVLHIVLQRLSAFSTNVRGVLEGGAAHNEFQSSWRKLGEQFREAVLEMRPRITVRDASDVAVHEVINIDDDGDDETQALEATPNERDRKHQVDEPQSPCPPKRSRMEDGTKASPNRINLVKVGGGLPTRPMTPRAAPEKMASDEVPNPFVKYLDCGRNFASIGEIRRLISKHSRTGIPGIVNEQVHMELCMQSVTPWEGPLEVLLDLTLSMLRDQANAILFQELSRWQQTQLFKQAHEHLSTFFDEFELSQREAATELYNLETYKLFTINHIALEQYRQEELEHLRRARRIRRAKMYVEQLGRMQRKTLNPDLRRRMEKDVKDEQLGKDPFETEIEVAAYVRGYYRTAALRFTDSVCLSVHGKLFREARDKIFYYLEQGLELNKGDGNRQFFILTLQSRPLT
jgi:hypothetical protein